MTRYRTNHLTVVSLGAGGVTTSSKYRCPGFSPTNISSTFFLYTLVTFTFCSPPSHSDIKKLWSLALSDLSVWDRLHAIPSATGFIPFLGHKTQHSDPALSGPCSHVHDRGNRGKTTTQQDNLVRISLRSKNIAYSHALQDMNWHRKKTDRCVISGLHRGWTPGSCCAPYRSLSPKLVRCSSVLAGSINLSSLQVFCGRMHVGWQVQV